MDPLGEDWYNPFTWFDPPGLEISKDGSMSLPPSPLPDRDSFGWKHGINNDFDGQTGAEVVKDISWEIPKGFANTAMMMCPITKAKGAYQAADEALQAGKLGEESAGLWAKILKKCRGKKPPTISYKKLAGQLHPETKIPFDKDGFPYFSKVSKKDVKIKFSGDRDADFLAADKKAILKETPENYTWHHHQDGETMQLVTADIHRQTGHTGGFSLLNWLNSF